MRRSVDFERIESVVCASVNAVCSALRYGYETRVDCATLYCGVAKVPLCVAVARQIVYMVLRDLYGLPYSAIARRSNRSLRGVMNGVCRARTLVHSDELYQRGWMEVRRVLEC